MNKINHPGTVKVWDIAVRIFHWSLVLAYAIAWFTEDFEEPHEIAGYVVLGLISFRLVWGFTGTKHARFADFVYAPSSIVLYLKSLLTTHPKQYLGHNPAGGAMIILLLLSLFGVSVSGVLLEEVEEGPQAQIETTQVFASLNPISKALADDDHDGDKGEENPEEEFWEEIHEFFANFSLFLVIVHIAGVLVASKLHKENMAKAMVTGRKRMPSGNDAD
ncbi:MAG: cytochrome b/b6 domain-containing protein [Gammaproteobacteria bacterium]